MMCRDIDDYSNKELIEELKKRQVPLVDIFSVADSLDIPEILLVPVKSFLKIKPLTQKELDRWMSESGISD